MSRSWRAISKPSVFSKITLRRACATSPTRLLEQQHARALRGAAADAPAQLMQLREAEALGVLDHHQRRVRHVDADLDHGRRHQHVDLAARRTRAIAAAFSSRLHAAVQQPDARAPGSVARQLGVQRDRRLQLELLRLLDQRAHPVRLPPFRALLARPARRSRPRRFWLTSRVTTGVRPGGISSITDTSRSA